MNTTTPTPRTDAIQELSYNVEHDEEVALAFTACRTLERELTAVTEQRDSLHELHNKNAARSKELLELCGTLREQRDRLAEALRKIQKVGLVAVDAFDELDRIDEIVDEALAAVKGGADE